jgi:hypothetical protein
MPILFIRWDHPQVLLGRECNWLSLGYQGWNDPYSFKKSYNNTNMPLVPRGRERPAQRVKSSNTSFEIINHCTKDTVSNLGGMVNEVWGTYQQSFGGDLPDRMDTLIVSY